MKTEKFKNKNRFQYSSHSLYEGVLFYNTKKGGVKVLKNNLLRGLKLGRKPAPHPLDTIENSFSFKGVFNKNWHFWNSIPLL